MAEEEKKEKTPCYVLTLSLHYEDWQRDKLDKTFSIAQKMSNLLIEDRKKALFQMERTREWRTLKADIAQSYRDLETLTSKKEKLEKDIEKAKETHTAKKEIKTLKEELKALKEELESIKNTREALFAHRDEMLERYGMSENDFQKRMCKYRDHYKCINSMVAQKLATKVWHRFHAYLFGKGEEIRFIPWTEFKSIEGKNNLTGIQFVKGTLRCRGMKIPLRRGLTPYEQEALKSHVILCRIIRIPWKDGWLYQLQLVLEGFPPNKGRRLGKGRVGIDPGTQTIAVVADSDAKLLELADKANLPNAELRRINRALDRSSRANNPQMYNPNGTIKRIDRLPKELLNAKGRRKWNNSKSYKKLAQKRRYLYAKLARIREVQHNTMANQLLPLGSKFYTETMNYRALAKKAKPTTPKEGEKNKRRKRFGKSLANKAPASFLNIIEKKVKALGGSFDRIDTRSAKASQYDHTTHDFKPKKLSQRWTALGDGSKIQRDLYSAFLIKNTNKTLDGFNRAIVTKTFPAFKHLHDLEVERLRGLGKAMPSSMGIRTAS